MFRYIDCGLSNIWLMNGYQHKNTGNKKNTEINDVAGLHRLIAHSIITRRSPLISSEMRFLRHEINLSRQSLAMKLGVEVAFITHWECSDRRLPRVADVNMRILYATTRLTGSDTSLSIHLLADLDYHPSPEPLVFKYTEEGWKLSSPATPP